MDSFGIQGGNINVQLYLIIAVQTNQIVFHMDVRRLATDRDSDSE